MSALLLVFILAVVVLILQLIQSQDELGRQQSEIAHQQSEFSRQVGTLQTAELVRQEILSDIESELSKRGIEVRISENNTVLSIPSALLGFESGSYEVAKQYRGVAKTIGAVISEAIRKDDRIQYLDTVFIEGHTDNVPYEGLNGTGNWGLSTFRAISLWDYWSKSLPANSRLDQLKSVEGSPLFSVSGYADTRPAVRAGSAASDLSIDRRIDIRFTIVRPSSEDLLSIQENLDEILVD